MKLLKNIFDFSLEFLPFSILKRIQKQKLILPLYHIVSDAKLPHIIHCYSYKNPKQFEKDLNIFLRHFNPISLHDLVQSINNLNEIRQRSFLITIDDGYREVYDIIAPILLKKSIPAVFFLNSAFVDNKNMSYRNKTSLIIDNLQNNAQSFPLNEIQVLLRDNDIINNDLKSAILSIQYHQKYILDDIAKLMNIDFDLYLKEKEPYLTSVQISELIKNGFDIGSHSIDHPLYKYLTLEEQLRQTRESFNFLEEKFPMPYKVFAFPHNDRGVKSFFKETHFNGEIQISFGTSSFSKGNCKNNLQRQSMENTNDTAKIIYKNLFKYEIFKQLKNNLTLLKPSSKKLNENKSKNSENNEKIHFEKIKVKNLAEFVKKYNKNKTLNDVAVISDQRALAHSLNPLADENDIGLILAYKGNNCVGYLGIIPGLAEIRNSFVKIYFPSSWLVSDEVRGQSVGSSLMKEALKLGKILICTGMNNTSESTLVNIGFEWMNSLHYWQINFEKLNNRLFRILDKSLIKRKNPTVQLIQANHPRLSKVYKSKIYKQILDVFESSLDSVYYKESKYIDFEIKKFNLDNYKFSRSKEIINWMLKYPWINSRENVENENNTGYFFSDVRELFSYIPIEIYSKGTKNKVGYLILSVSKEKDKTTLKLLDHELEIQNKYNILLGLIIKYALSYNADRVEFPDPIAQLLLSHKIVPSHLLKQKERKYLYFANDMSSRSALAMKNISPEYCDGDLPFY